MPKGLVRNNVLDLIREDLGSYVGKRIIVKAHRGRRKVDEVEGILERTYPRLFVVLPLGRMSFSRHTYTYSDVLTASIEVVYNGSRIGYTQ
ncbi:MAG: Veg family protein [Betaproteobacteria bacterium]